MINLKDISKIRYLQEKNAWVKSEKLWRLLKDFISYASGVIPIFLGGLHLLLHNLRIVRQSGLTPTYIAVLYATLSYRLTITVYNWRPPSLGELTPIVFKTGLTHLVSEASNYGNV